MTWVGTTASRLVEDLPADAPAVDNILLKELKTRWTSTLKESSFWPPVALENNNRD